MVDLHAVPCEQKGFLTLPRCWLALPCCRSWYKLVLMGRRVGCVNEGGSGTGLPCHVVYYRSFLMQVPQRLLCWLLRGVWAVKIERTSCEWQLITCAAAWAARPLETCNGFVIHGSLMLKQASTSLSLLLTNSPGPTAWPSLLLASVALYVA